MRIVGLNLGSPLILLPGGLPSPPPPEPPPPPPLPPGRYELVLKGIASYLRASFGFFLKRDTKKRQKISQRRIINLKILKKMPCSDANLTIIFLILYFKTK
jgi:hypothetical protein